MNKERRLWVMPTIGALLTLPCGAYVFGDPIPPEPLTLAQLGDLFEREIAVYENAGLREVESGTGRFGDSLELTLEGGQCIGVVTASEAPWPAEIRLATRDGDPISTSGRTHVASVAWCDPFATRMRIALIGDWQSYLPHTAQSLEGTIHYRIFTGRTDAFDLASLPRGRPNEVRRGATLARMAADRAAIAERSSLPDARALLEPVNLTRDAGALLVPRSAATWDSYRAAMTRFTVIAIDHVFPRVHEASPGEVAEFDTVTAEGVISIDDESWRVLAVVDPGDLPVDGGVPCATVRFGRLGPEGVDIRRFDLVTAQPLSVEDVAASDTFCPTDGVRLYVAPVTDAHEYVLRIFAAEGPSAARRAGRALEAPPYPPLVEALDACESSGEGEGCLEAARELRDGVHVPVDEPRARNLLQRACDVDGAACGEYAEHLLTLDDEGLDETAASALRRACGERQWNACARLGDLRRLGRGVAADYRDAHALYQRACTNGIDAACRNKDAMELLDLVSESPEADNEEPQDEPDAEESEPNADSSEANESEPHAEDPPGITPNE